MINLILVYRDQMIRAALGGGPAILAKQANTTALDRMAARLVDYEEALALIRAKGYGARGQTLLEVVKAMPLAPASAVQVHDVWSAR